MLNKASVVLFAQRYFYTQIVRNDAKLSSGVERNHEKKLKVRKKSEKGRCIKDF